jgi:hypothetical protein
MAVALRLRGQTIGEVAAALNVARSTVRRWESDERFQQEIDRQLALLPVTPIATEGRMAANKGSSAAPPRATIATAPTPRPRYAAAQKPFKAGHDDHLEDLECEALIAEILSRR